MGMSGPLLLSPVAWLFYHGKQETGREQPAAGQRSGQKRRKVDKSTVSRQGLTYSYSKERPANREIGEEEQAVMKQK